MTQHLTAVTLVVPDYDRAISFYVGVLAFDLVEDTDLGQGKRWVLVAPPGSRETRLLLARAAGPAQTAAIGKQAGGRIFLFLSTDDFARDHARLLAAGVIFTESPRIEPYGVVAVFADPFGNLWDLIEPTRRVSTAPEQQIALDPATKAREPITALATQDTDRCANGKL